jgi:hypothetical protein
MWPDTGYGEHFIKAAATLVRRRAYGYISFRNYRLGLLNACGG